MHIDDRQPPAAQLPHAQRRGALERYGLTEARGYASSLSTAPPSSTTPDRLSAVLARVLRVLRAVGARRVPASSAHPGQAAKGYAGPHLLDGILATEPLEYFDFIALEASARLVVTDSGGVQEETSALGVPCLTYRDNTERAVTCELGTNQLVGVDPGALARVRRGRARGPAAAAGPPLFPCGTGTPASAPAPRSASCSTGGPAQCRPRSPPEPGSASQGDTR